MIFEVEEPWHVLQAPLVNAEFIYLMEPDVPSALTKTPNQTKCSIYYLVSKKLSFKTLFT
jgi:hypothetical protein